MRGSVISLATNYRTLLNYNNEACFSMKVFKYSVIALPLLIIQAGCSTEAEPEVENTPPSIVFEQVSVPVVEGKVVSVKYVATDAETPIAKLVVLALNSDNLKGSVSIEHSNGVVKYTAPWVAEGASFNENVMFQISDGKGGVAEQSVSFVVEDLNSPVKVSVAPPLNGYGYHNTQTDSLINVYFQEGQLLELDFKLQDDDGDTLKYHYSVTEGLVFTNQIADTMVGDSVKLSLQVPMIKTPSESFIISLVVNDGDETVTASANITVVNKPVLSWLASAPMTLSEKTGGKLTFSSSESPAYLGEYSVNLTDANGVPLDFDLPFSLNKSGMSIDFGASAGIGEDKTVNISLSIVNIITNGAGETYEEKTELKRTIVLINDRDDSFNVSIDSFYDQLAWFLDAKGRKDEGRVISSLTNYLFLQSAITRQELLSINSAISTAMNTEYAELTKQADVITNLINAGDVSSDLYSKLSVFGDLVYKIGSNGRQATSEKLVAVKLKKPEVFVNLSLPLTGGVAQVFSSKLTHYVGNQSYGFFEDKDKTKWQFKPEYSYLAVVDITDTYCF
jgi:hypothetical protein